jgi:hypothetical protein
MVSGLEVAGIAVGSLGALALLKWVSKKSLNTGQDTGFGASNSEDANDSNGGTRRKRGYRNTRRKKYHYLS